MAHAVAGLSEGGGSGEEEEIKTKKVWTCTPLVCSSLLIPAALHVINSLSFPLILVLSLPLSSSQTMLKSSNDSCRLVERLVERTVVGMCCVVLYQLPLT